MSESRDELPVELNTEELFRHFSSLLKDSGLGTSADPLYSLPWVLVIGDPSSGKDSALASARLSKPVLQDNEFIRGAGCNIWPYQEAIAVTAPLAADPTADSPANRAWLAVLRQLKKVRPKEPVNAIVMTVSTDHIRNLSADALYEEGKKNHLHLRLLLDELGVQVPVYILMTKCDFLRGFSVYASRLKESKLEENMGFDCDPDSANLKSSLALGMSKLEEKLGQSCLKVQMEGDASEELSALPLEFSRLEQKLSTFLLGVFQTGTAESSIQLRHVAFGAVLRPEHLTKGRMRRGVFLREFFTKTVPGSQPNHSGLNLKRWLPAMAITVVLCLSGLFRYFVVEERIRDLTNQAEATGKIVSEPNYSGRLDLALKKLELLFQYRRMVEDWRLAPFEMPAPGLNQIQKMRRAWVTEFEDNILPLMFDDLANRIDELLRQQDNSEELRRYREGIVGMLSVFEEGSMTADESLEVFLPNEKRTKEHVRMILFYLRNERSPHEKKIDWIKKLRVQLLKLNKAFSQ